MAVEKTTTAQTARASAALPASGAYDTSPAALSLNPQTQTVTLWCTYTRGTGGGYAGLRPELSPDGVTWYAAPLVDGTLTTSAPYGSLPLLAAQYNLPAPSSGAAFRIAVSLDVAGARFFRVGAAEVGQSGTPGTLAMDFCEDAS